MSNMERKIVSFELDTKAVDDEGAFGGLGSTFGNVDLGKDKIVKGAFDDTLTDWQSKGQLPMMPWYHDMSDPIGEWESMSVNGKGLKADGFLWVPGNKSGRHPIEGSMQIHNLLKSNGPKGLSIGYSANKFEYTKEKGETIRVLEKVELYELSPVPFGMNPKALITTVKSLDSTAKDLTQRQLEDHLRDAGFSRKEAKAVLANGFEGLVALRDAEAKDNPHPEVDALFTSFHDLLAIMKGK